MLKQSVNPIYPVKFGKSFQIVWGWGTEEVRRNFQGWSTNFWRMLGWRWTWDWMLAL